MRARMRQCQRFAADLQLAVDQDVQVERARAVGNLAHAPVAAFDRQQLRQQLRQWLRQQDALSVWSFDLVTLLFSSLISLITVSLLND